MKSNIFKPLTLILPILCLITLTACSSSPKNTAKAFTEHLARGEITQAKKYATEQTGEMLDMALSMGSLPVDPDFKFVFVESVIEGSKANVTYKEGEYGSLKVIELVKLDGVWKVHATK